MSALIALYPRAWRDRYEGEFRTLMSERPPDLGDRIDIVRGALDARLHPQVRTDGSGESAPSRLVQRSGLLAVPGGLLWILASVGFYTTPVSAQLGYKDTGSLVFVVIAGSLFTGWAAVANARSTAGRHPVVSIAAIAILAGTVLLATPWPLLVLGYFTIIIGTMLFALASVPRLGPAAILLALAGLFATVFNTENELALLLVPLGVAWIVFGLATGVRGQASTLEQSGGRRPTPTSD